MSDAAWGIEPGYRDVAHRWQEAPESTLEAIRRAMDVSGERPPAGPPLQVLRAGGEPLHLAGRWELHAEDGEVRRVSGSVADVPLGYHQLYNEADGRRLRLIVSPGRCHLPRELRAWGWTVQLYAARSTSSWGMGDLADLRRMGEWSAAHGASVLMLNPLHAGTPVTPLQPSPYYPSSRCFRNPLYLRVEEVPGATELGADLDAAAAGGRALNASRRIDRDEVFRLKLDALGAIWDRFGGDPDYDRYVAKGGRTLAGFATFCALAQTLGRSWRQWPAGYRHPDAPEVADFAQANESRVAFHQWLQWQLDRQLRTAGATIDLMQDLAIGVDPDGADAWLWQDCIAPGMSVGAPPDEFNTKGQDWGLPPFDPWKLRAAGFDPFVQTLRAGFRSAGGLRVDHVMGLFRLFWIPAGASPGEGTYVRYPWAELLDILALESHRAGAYVVGEDLGTVEDSIRDELGARDVLSYRVLWFEEEPPASFPVRALAAVTTHDLPTVAGLWTGTDLEAQRERHMEPNVESTEKVRSRLRDWTRLDDDAPVTEVVQRTYELLAQAPSAVVVASLDDALGVRERPNYPGTTDGTNWSLALPAPLEEVEADPRVDAVATALNRRS
jgi:4-alpha-glucanotransferase